MHNSLLVLPNRAINVPNNVSIQDISILTDNFMNSGFALHILLNSVLKNHCPTNGSNLFPTFVISNANRPHPMNACIVTLTSQFLFQYVKGMSFGIGLGPHYPWKLSVLTLYICMRCSSCELDSPFYWIGRVLNIRECKATIFAACI